MKGEIRIVTQGIEATAKVVADLAVQAPAATHATVIIRVDLVVQAPAATATGTTDVV